MKGTTTLTINQATMQEALQLYFDTKIFREGGRKQQVRAIKLDRSQPTSTYGSPVDFVVELVADESAGDPKHSSFSRVLL